MIVNHKLKVSIKEAAYLQKKSSKKKKI